MLLDGKENEYMIEKIIEDIDRALNNEAYLAVMEELNE